MADGSQHIIVSAAEALRSERERQKLSIADIAKETCIRSQFLEAIENEDDAALPGQAFVVGFVRSYACALKMDADEVVRAFRSRGDDSEVGNSTALSHAERQGARDISAVKLAAGAAALEQPRRGVPKWLMPFLGLVGAVLSWSWFNADQTPAGLIEHQKIAEVTRLAAIQAQYSLDTEEDSVSGSVSPSEEDWQTFSGIVEVKLAAQEDAQALVGSRNNSGSLLMPAANAKSAALGGVITLVAEEDTWVQLSRADGTELWSGLLHAGDEYKADSSDVFLTTGNAGGIYLDVDGQKVGPLGERGAIIDALELDHSIAEAVPLALTSDFKNAQRDVAVY